MHTQLMGASGMGLQFDPASTVARPFDDPVARLGRLAIFFVNMHFLAAGTRLLGKRQIDHAIGNFRHAHYNRPIDLADVATGKTLGEKGRCPGRTRQQDHPAGILVEPVDQLGPRFRIKGQRVEQAIEMSRGLAAALCRQSGRLVDDNRRLVLVNNQFPGEIDLVLRQVRLGFRDAPRPFDFLWGDPQYLSGLQAITRRHSFAIYPQLPGPRPARNNIERHVVHVPLEPAIDPDIIIVGRNRELPDIQCLQRLHLFLGRALRGFFLGAAFGGWVKAAHASALTVIRPANSASTAPITEIRA